MKFLILLFLVAELIPGYAFARDNTAPEPKDFYELHNPRDYITYADFISEVEAGNVLSVYLGEYFKDITGTMNFEGKVIEFKTYAVVGSVNDPLLMRLLRGKVSIGVQSIEMMVDDDPYDPVELFVSFAVSLLPMISLVLLAVVISQLKHINNRISDSKNSNGDSAQ